MCSGEREKFGYDQISRLSSSLTKEGRELAANLEEELGVPVYYYLHRYYGVSPEKELHRRCPGCKGRWLMQKPERRYEFRCEKCRLISVMAKDFEDEHLGRKFF